MGLDMYLRKRSHIFAEYDKDIAGTVKIVKGKKTIPVKLERISEIIESVGYWRKANQIHKWFVDKVQKGVDDCGDYYVTLEQLQELLGACETISKSKNNDVAMRLLPPQSGFFFGGSEVNEYYYEDIDLTIKILTPLIKELKAEKKKDNGVSVSIYYHSSW